MDPQPTMICCSSYQSAPRAYGQRYFLWPAPHWVGMPSPTAFLESQIFKAEHSALRPLRSNHRVFQSADAADLDAHDITGLQEAWRRAARTDTRRVAGGDHVSVFERDACRDKLDQRRHVEDELAGFRMLHLVAVHQRAQLEAAPDRKLIERHQCRTHRSKRVERLAHAVAAAVLIVARGHIVHDRIAGNVGHCRVAADTFGALPDNHSELTLPIDHRAHSRDLDASVRADHGGHRFRKYERGLWNLAPSLRGMVAIVEGNAEDLPR